jgi:1-deoxy-D-xylulose-5-phosphate reductoisomerase
MVEYVDGSVLAQLGIPDMAIPISYILAYPDRLPLPHLPALDLATAAQLTFFQPDFVKFPCLGLAYEALARGGTCSVVLNAVNEVAVASFLAGQLRFSDIATLNRRVLDAHDTRPVNDLGDLLEADRWARSQAQKALELTPRRAMASA